MKIYLVQGEHWNVPGIARTSHFEREDAERAALALVNSLIQDGQGFDGQLAELTEGADWRVGLRQLQEARVRHCDGEEFLLVLMENLAARTRGLPEDRVKEAVAAELVLASECNVWIEEGDIADGPAGPWAHPVPLATMEAYRDLAEAAREILDASGGSMPDWLQAEAITLETRLERVERLDPPSDSKPQVSAEQAGADALNKFRKASADLYSSAKVYDAGAEAIHSTLGIIRAVDPGAVEGAIGDGSLDPAVAEELGEGPAVPECAYCGEEKPAGPASTWQQWQCGACGSWNDVETDK